MQAPYVSSSVTTTRFVIRSNSVFCLALRIWNYIYCRRFYFKENVDFGVKIEIFQACLLLIRLLSFYAVDADTKTNGNITFVTNFRTKHNLRFDKYDNSNG